MDKLGRLEVEQLKVTSTTPPADSGFYKIDETTMGVVGDLKFRHPKTGAMSSALTATTSAQGVDRIVAIGDSRAMYAERTPKSASVASGLGDIIALGVLDGIANGTGSLEYNTASGFRFSSTGATAYGAYVPAVPGIITIPDANGIRLKLGVRNLLSSPGVTSARDVTISGSIITGFGARGIAAWMGRYLGAGGIPVQALGIGGLAAGDFAALLTQVMAQTVGGGSGACAVVTVGTNDVSGITDVAQIPAVIAALQSAWIQLRDFYSRVLIVEEHARYVGSTTTALPAAAQTAIRKIQTAARAFAAAHSATVRVLPTLDYTVDPTATTLIPRSGVLDDGIHPTLQTCQVLGSRGAEILRSFTAVRDDGLLAPVAGGFDGQWAAFVGTVGLQVGSAGTVATGFSGQISTGWTTVRQSGSDALALSKSARSDVPGAEWLTATASTATTADQWDIKTVAVSIASLGLAVGDSVQFAVELAIDSSSAAGPIEPTWRFVEPNGYAQATVADGSTIKTTSAHGVMWYYTPEIVVPAGSVTIEFRLRADVDVGGSAAIKVGRVAYRKA